MNNIGMHFWLFSRFKKKNSIIKLRVVMIDNNMTENPLDMRITDFRHTPNKPKI